MDTDPSPCVEKPIDPNASFDLLGQFDGSGEDSSGSHRIFEISPSAVDVPGSAPTWSVSPSASVTTVV